MSEAEETMKEAAGGLTEPVDERGRNDKVKRKEMVSYLLEVTYRERAKMRAMTRGLDALIDRFMSLDFYDYTNHDEIARDMVTLSGLIESKTHEVMRWTHCLEVAEENCYGKSGQVLG
jgi:hypothetical protein